jgi:hypothetical protein
MYSILQKQKRLTFQSVVCCATLFSRGNKFLSQTHNTHKLTTANYRCKIKSDYPHRYSLSFSSLICFSFYLRLLVAFAFEATSLFVYMGLSPPFILRSDFCYHWRQKCGVSASNIFANLFTGHSLLPFYHSLIQQLWKRNRPFGGRHRRWLPFHSMRDLSTTQAPPSYYLNVAAEAKGGGFRGQRFIHRSVVCVCGVCGCNRTHTHTHTHTSMEIHLFIYIY